MTFATRFPSPPAGPPPLYGNLTVAIELDWEPIGTMFVNMTSLGGGPLSRLNPGGATQFDASVTVLKEPSPTPEYTAVYRQSVLGNEFNFHTLDRGTSSRDAVQATNQSPTLWPGSVVDLVFRVKDNVGADIFFPITLPLNATAADDHMSWIVEFTADASDAITGYTVISRTG